MSELSKAKRRCQDCVSLVEGENGEWVCDEYGRDVETVEKCPEDLGKEE